MKQVFVRAKPSKISITETYYYTSVIGDNRSWDFTRAEGEIKLEFPYDGGQDGRLNSNALKDLEIQDPDRQAKQARVGHLAILKAGKSAWKDRKLEGKTIPIIIDIEDLQKKLESGQKLTIKFSYRLNIPESSPVFLGDVMLTDQAPVQSSEQMEGKPQDYPTPVLLMKFNVPVRDETLEVKETSGEKIRNLIDLARQEQKKKVIFLPGQADINTISQHLLALAQTDRGGYLFLGIEFDGKIQGLNEGEAAHFPQKVMEAALVRRLPLPIMDPKNWTRKKGNNVL